MRLLLTRPLIESEVSAQILTAMGYEVVIKPLTQLKVTNTKLEATEALIFTSFRAFEAITHLETLNHIPCFVVGVKAEQALQKLGFRAIIRGVDGNDLGKKIKDSFYQNFIWASGEAISVDLVSLCFAKNITRKIVYKMEYQHQDIDLKGDKIDGVLHYSLENTLEFVKIARNIDCSRHFALSQRIASPLTHCHVSDHPNETSLFRLVRAILPLA